MKKSTLRYALLSVLVSVLIHFRWFTSFAILSDGDWVVRFRDEMLHMLTWPEAWQPVGMGNFYLTVPFWFMEVTQAALHRIGLTYAVIERVEYLWPIVVLTPLGAFLLARKLTRSDVAAFLASLAWSCNVYFFVKQQSHIYIMLANALMPFAALAYVHWLRSRTPRSLIAAVLSLFAVTATDFRLFYVLAFILAGWAFSDFVAERGWRNHRLLTRHALAAVAPLAAVLLLNAYWLIGFAKTGSISSNSILDRGVFGDYLVTTADALTLHRGDWTDAVPLTFGTAPVPLRLWWLPLAALAGLWVRRREKDAVFFAAVAVVGVFLSKQSDFPMPEAYRWLFVHVPGFKAFRESSKFFVVQALGYTVLVAYLVEWLQTDARGTWRRLRPAAYAALAILPLWNAVPLLTGDMRSIFVPVSELPGYRAVNEFFSSQPDFFRYVNVPGGSMWIGASPAHPKMSASDLMDLRVMAQPDGTDVNGSSAWRSEMFRWPQTGALMDLLSIRYAVVPVPNIANHDDIFALLNADRKKVVADLDASPFLHRKDVGSSDVLVYENPTARPFAVTTSAPDTLAAPSPYVPAEVRVVDVSRMELVLKGVSGPTYLHVSSSYHPGWQLLDRLPIRWEQLSVVGKEIDGVTHERDVAGTNLYRIDPDSACKVLLCTPNPDGSFNVHVALFFAPQAYFDLGSVITAAGLLSCVVALAAFTWRERRRKTV